MLRFNKCRHSFGAVMIHVKYEVIKLDLTKTKLTNYEDKIIDVALVTFWRIYRGKGEWKTRSIIS